MKLTEISLHNFRQFRGRQVVPLAPGDNQPVTLIFGANGSGKTTLLNAFTWALYGVLSEDVEEQNRIITDSVWAQAAFGDQIPVEVEVSFDHEGVAYRAKRHALVRKSSDDQGPVSPTVSLWETHLDGSSVESSGPQQKIDSILPQRLSRFFFFNGERIEKLVNRRAYAEVKQDIKTLLGLEQVERALVHLPRAERKLSGDLRKHGGERAAGIQEAIEEHQDAAEALRAELSTLDNGLGLLTEEREAVLDLLRKHEGAGPLQKRRDEVADALTSETGALNRSLAERRSLVATRGFIAFTGGIAERAEALASSLHEKGALPAPLKRDFVESLLEEGYCICGTQLVEGSAASRHVQDWRERAGLAEVEATWQRLSGQVRGLLDARSELLRALETSAEAIARSRETISKLEESKGELDAAVAKLPLEDVRRLEAKRNDLDGRIGHLNREIGAKRDALGKVDAEQERLRAELKKAEVTDELALKARERLELVQEVTKALTEILSIRSDDMRRRLDEKIRRVFEEITVKPYVPELSDDFELGLFQLVGNGDRLPVPKSTGENQILSLSFVAAVSQLAREVRVERHAQDGHDPDSGVYPLVMDAAFGSLDINYQRDVSRALARIAPQMVVLVSKSQGEREVMAELGPHVNHLGVIVSHTTNHLQDPEAIELLGNTYPYVATRSDDDWAEFTVVK